MRRGPVLAVLCLVIGAGLGVRPWGPAHAQGTAVLGGITFSTGTNGCTGILVGVYGSSALQSVILAAAADYCNTFADKSTAPDVEYAAGGTSCPGMDYAADHGDGNEIGASGVFAVYCSGSQARNPSLITDTSIAVNVVNTIMQCSGATDLQGGSIHPPASDIPCRGSATTNTPSCTLANLYFPAPNNMDVLAAQQLWNNQSFDWAQVNGCAGNAPGVQQRVAVAGARITFCNTIYGPGQDSQCSNNTAPGPAATTSVMLSDVCGNPYTSPATAPVDAAGTIGYVTRSALVVDPRQPTGGQLPLSNCGLVQLAGKTAYNGTCDPTNAATFTAANSGLNNEDNVATCNGDLDMVASAYPAWGYEHLDLNAAATANTEAQDFIVFVQAAEDALLQQYGFMLACQMQVERRADGGALSFTAGATC